MGIQQMFQLPKPSFISRLLPSKLFKNFTFLEEGGSTTKPVWMKPYDPFKYDILSPKLKQSSGYCLLDVDPMPRKSIMKIGYVLLERVKVIPEKVLFRIYQEEKIRW